VFVVESGKARRQYFERRCMTEWTQSAPDLESPHTQSLPTLAIRWSRLRTYAQGLQAPVPFVAEGLPLRAQRAVYQASATTVQELLALDPEELVEHANIGRSTVASLLCQAEESLARVTSATGQPEGVSEGATSVVPANPPVDVDRKLPDFVEVADMALAGFSERSVRIVVARFEEHLRTIDVAGTENITRERVRQVEERFVRAIRAAIRRHRLGLQNILDDDVIEYDELAAGRYVARHAPGFYVSLARAVLTGGDSYVDVERHMARQFEVLVAEIRNNDDFILGRLVPHRAEELAREVTPALAECSASELWQRINAQLKAHERGGRLIGRQPQVGRIIRALLRAAGGPTTVSLLVNQLRVVLGAYGEVSYFDQVRLRNKLHSMEGVHLHAQGIASLDLPEPAVADKWTEMAVRTIRRAGKPYSLVRFLNEHPDAPFDAFALASLLRSNQQVVHIGRRLYAPAEYEAESSLRIAALLEEALSKAKGPVTRRELLAYVRERRDLICTQIESYFSRVPNLVAYTRDVVGLAPLDRDVMLRMLSREECVLSLLGSRDEDSPLSISALWLVPEEEADISRAEEQTIVKAAKAWRIAFVKDGSSGLFFGTKGDE